MIYGLIGCGGFAKRLGINYPKELLPLPSFDFYYPLAKHTTDKMELAGCSKIYFVHGKKYKEQMVDYFNGRNYVHILEKRPGFANILRNGYEAIKPDDDDSILFGLADSVFEGNCYPLLAAYPGVNCALFKTDNSVRVDRLTKDGQFKIKSEFQSDCTPYFWGALGFRGRDIKKMIDNHEFINHSEIGNIINNYPKAYFYYDKYFDLGLWRNWGAFQESKDFGNREIEYKYSAQDVDAKDFVRFFKKTGYKKYRTFSSTDYYFQSPNKNIEFVRYRRGTENVSDGSTPDISVKDFNTNAINRLEIPILLEKKNKFTDVFYFLTLLNLIFEFEVTKTCHIFDYKSHTVVFYSFTFGEKEYRIIEVELNKGFNFSIFEKIEKQMVKIPGFDPTKTIKESKYQIIKNLIR